MTKKIEALVQKISAAFEGAEPGDALMVLATTAAALCHKFGASPAAFIEAFNVATEASTPRTRDRHPRHVG